MAGDGGLGHVRVGAAGPGMFAAYAAWSAREIELQALATLAALAQISTPSAAHFLKFHQLLVQKFAADRDRQRSSFETADFARGLSSSKRLAPGFRDPPAGDHVYSRRQLFANDATRTERGAACTAASLVSPLSRN
jgi:hypothetical protein